MLRLAGEGSTIPFIARYRKEQTGNLDEVAVQKAIEAGLPRDKAVEALTRTPAAFFGLDRALGTIEPGKVANLVLTEGELLAKETKVRYAFVDGTRFELKEAKPGEGGKPTVNLTGRWEVSLEGGMGMKLTVEFAQEEGEQGPQATWVQPL